MAGRRAAVTSLLERAVRAGLSPGFVAAWGAPGGDLEIVASGRSAVAPTSEDVDPAGWYDLASLTKPLVTTTLVLLLARRGAIGLGTRVGEVLAAVRGTAWADSTVRHLLTHTSGMPAWAPLYAEGTGRGAVMGCLCALVPESPAGGRVVYSCPGFVLLGLMLEAVTGSSLGELLRTEILEPLDLEEELGYRPDPNVRRPAAGARRPAAEAVLLEERGLDPDLIPEDARHLPDDGNARALGGEAGNAGLFGSARGVATIAYQYLSNRSVLLDEPELRSATSLWTPGLEQARGLGWQLASTPGCSAGPGLSPSAFGHTGFTGCSVWVDPASRVVLVLLGNRHHPEHRGVDLHPLRRRFHALVNR